MVFCNTEMQGLNLRSYDDRGLQIRIQAQRKICTYKTINDSCCVRSAAVTAVGKTESPQEAN
jgi:hypothetical protein